MRSETVSFKIERNDLGQIADCLGMRLEQWQHTAEYFEADGYYDGSILECSDVDEAKAMIATYQRLL